MRKKILVFGFWICLISGYLVMQIQVMKYSHRQYSEIERRVSEIERKVSEIERKIDACIERQELLEDCNERLDKISEQIVYLMYGREGLDEYLKKMKEEAEEKRVAQMHEIFESLEPQKYITLEEFLGKSDNEEKNPFLQ